MRTLTQKWILIQNDINHFKMWYNVNSYVNKRHKQIFKKKLIFKKIVRQTARLWKKHFYNKQTYLKIEKLSIDIYSTYDYWYYNLEFHKIVLTKLSKIFKHLKYRYHTIKKKEEGWIQNLQYSLPFKAKILDFKK